MIVDVDVMLVGATVSEKNILPSGSKRVRAAPSKFRTSEYDLPKPHAKVLASIPLTALIATESATLTRSMHARTHARANTR